ncbi:MAG: hypothetical protein UU85_C0008G0010 [Candidatus Wolfebacteria bacterium GW2011_GWA2_42_10]|uniref:Uncharacterized protein n=2 Tax=Candidatus Wolfeibacteriota TaxID=1752735 RepID=A0A0G0ZSS4_9BACT|nr:MAG: hypothetical protein UU38_C0003G0205 [Candidatus Wolfebacteria bacterium GW2011_GWB1_41_12]KKS25056.1 MAG: hypothetical protein UU85_C0008G0010 [Candidatus Wolfebacteria bacterium GW2011_GWA2_42_10]KKT56353.1 MAG: hypothetical protein UW50_C0002G0030 [Candidatus Wolfebacteria bacterium GW2011_GWA1_44_24]
MVERCPDKTEVIGSIPMPPTSRAISSVVERFIDIEKVGGSIPPSRTKVDITLNNIYYLSL